MSGTSMDFTSFTKIILENLQKMLGEGYMVFAQSVRKNNGVRRTGIVARRIGQNTSPTIYIDGLYTQGITREEADRISEGLYNDFRAAEFGEEPDLSGFCSYETAWKGLAFKMISAEKNKELLGTIPHKLFHNLAVVFYYTLREAPFYGKASVLVNSQHMQHWGVSTGELYKRAFSNTPRLFPGVIEDAEKIMQEIFMGTIKGDGLDRAGYEKEEAPGEKWMGEMACQMARDCQRGKIPMYVLTNRQRHYGAACLLYPGLLEKFADRAGQDFYVLPSSVHEMILVPAGVDVGKDSLREIVADINRKHVAEEEVLADSVYYYSRGKKKVILL